MGCHALRQPFCLLHLLLIALVGSCMAFEDWQPRKCVLCHPVILSAALLLAGLTQHVLQLKQVPQAKQEAAAAADAHRAARAERRRLSVCARGHHDHAPAAAEVRLPL